MMRRVDPRFRPLALVLVLTSFALTGYWWFTFSGLYARIAHLQLDMSGAYDVYLTGALTCLASLLPLVALSFVLPREGTARPKTMSPEGQKAIVGLARVYAFPVILGISGVYFLVLGTSTGAYREYPIAAVHAASDLTSRHVGVRGPFAPMRRFTVRHRANSSTDLIDYFALRANVDELACVVLKVSRPDFHAVQQRFAAARAAGRFEGLVTFENAAELRALGLGGLAQEVKVIEFGKDSREDMLFGVCFLVMAVMWLGAALLVKRFRKRRAAHS